MISRLVLAVLIGASFSFSQSPKPTPQTVPANSIHCHILKRPAWDEPNRQTSRSVSGSIAIIAASESSFHFKPVKKKLDCSRSDQLLF